MAKVAIGTFPGSRKKSSVMTVSLLSSVLSLHPLLTKMDTWLSLECLELGRDRGWGFPPRPPDCRSSTLRSTLDLVSAGLGGSVGVFLLFSCAFAASWISVSMGLYFGTVAALGPRSVLPEEMRFFYSRTMDLEAGFYCFPGFPQVCLSFVQGAWEFPNETLPGIAGCSVSACPVYL